VGLNTRRHDHDRACVAVDLTPKGLGLQRPTLPNLGRLTPKTHPASPGSDNFTCREEQHGPCCRQSSQALSCRVVDHRRRLLLLHIIAGDEHVEPGQALRAHDRLAELRKARLRRGAADANLATGEQGLQELKEAQRSLSGANCALESRARKLHTGRDPDKRAGITPHDIAPHHTA
jgi:hypothetical protein